MIYKQDGNPNLSYIQQTLNTFYYATGFPCSYIPFDSGYLYPNQIGLPSSLEINQTIKYILMNVNYSMIDCQTWQKNNLTYLTISLYHKKIHHGIILADISQANILQHASLKTMFSLCIKSSAFIINEKLEQQEKIESKTGRIANVFKGNNEIKHHPYHLEKSQFQNMLLTGEFSMNITNDYVMPILGLDELRSIKNHSIISISLLARSAINLGLDAHSAFSISDHYILEIEKTDTIEDLPKIVNSALREYHFHVRDKKDSRPPIVEAMVQYIENHLNMKISLDEFAATTEYTYTYLSALFKKTIGMNFTEYASSQKIEKSCLLLKDSSHSIQLISDMCGYSYSYQYIKAFKKIMGVTPGGYRKVIQAK